MTAEWKKYTKDMKQKIEMFESDDGVMLRYSNGDNSIILITDEELNLALHDSTQITHYLICEPLPHAEMIAQHAMTGQTVETAEGDGCWLPCTPSWHKDSQYRFKQPEKEKIYYRCYLISIEGRPKIRTVNKKSEGYPLPEIESFDTFVRWIHTEWQEVEL